jgi:hypothetical protein
MPSQVTYTGKIGAAVQLTAKVFPDVRRMTLEFSDRVLTLNYNEPNGEPKQAILDMSGATVTLTDTVTANQHVIVVSVT